ncbi:hypothetical protein IFR05_001611 [Cadophora sp. M221]|nr:hypothetical protein IFR05_001611 [Cadophora sp. M221]
MDSFKNMSHTVMDSHIELGRSWIIVMCRATRFHIIVSHKDLWESRFGTEYSEMVAKAMDDDDEEDHDFALNVPKEITFKDFYDPPTHHLKLLVSGSSLSTKATRDHGTMNAFHLMIPSRELPPFSEVPRAKASDLRIISDTKWDDYMSEIPQKAITSDGTSRFFKPADDKKQLLREVDMHLRIREAGLRDTIKVATLHSIVVSDDAKMTIGLLFDLISSTSDSLYTHKNTALASEYHARWKQQVTNTVEKLHSYNLVWGDVHRVTLSSILASTLGLQTLVVGIL